MVCKRKLPIVRGLGPWVVITRAVTKPSGRYHGHSSPMTPTYRAWIALCARKYKYRGQTCPVAPKWALFQAFLRDVGECPEGHRLERIDRTKGFVPGNVRYIPNRRPPSQRKSAAAPVRPETRNQRYDRELADVLAATSSATDDVPLVD